MDLRSGRVGKPLGDSALRNIAAKRHSGIPLGDAVMQSAKLDLIRCNMEPRGSIPNEGIGGSAGLRLSCTALERV
jgi:hypothetical protein